MTRSSDVKQRNLSLELTKLVAACFVVFIHVPFPHRMGQIVSCVARFAVPFFFAVSGYYSFGIDATKTGKRMVHMLKLHLLAAAINILFTCFMVSFSDWNVVSYLRWGSLPSQQKWARWFLLQVNPYGGHLWYLTSLLVCYGALWIYNKFWQDRQQKNGPWYYACFSLFAIYFTMSVLLPVEEVELPFKAYRNGWLMGIPMFAMGMFLHEYEERICGNFGLTDVKMILGMVLGIGLSLLQTMAGYAAEIPLGMFLTVTLLVLFVTRHPRIPVKNLLVQKIVSRFGVLSTAVYILHLSALEVYDVFLKEGACTLLGTKEDNLEPLIVLAMTFLAAFVWERIDWIFFKRK